MKDLYLFTVSFPYFKAREDTFLQYEIPQLEKKFDNITIMPGMIDGDKQELINNIRIDESFANYLRGKQRINIGTTLFKALTSKLFYREIWNEPKILIKPRFAIRLILAIEQTYYKRKWLTNYFKSELSKDTKAILYTYWFTNLTTALGLIAKDNKNLILVTRAHGIDLYEERNNGYIPLRKQTIDMLDKFYFVSEHGLQYIREKYPKEKSKYRLAALGVPNPNVISTYSNDNTFRIVSCSAIIPLKRVDLLLKGLIEFASDNRKKKILWTHFGDGELMNDIKRQSEEFAPENLECRIMGHVQNEKVLDYYKNNPIDVFITLSQTEGGRPVSIMESQSFGIPVIGTRVGGIPEIVNEENGTLLTPNPTPKEISESLEWFLRNPDKSIPKRRASRLNWENNFNAEINFRTFAEDVSNI